METPFAGQPGGDDAASKKRRHRGRRGGRKHRKDRPAGPAPIAVHTPLPPRAERAAQAPAKPPFADKPAQRRPEPAKKPLPAAPKKPVPAPAPFAVRGGGTYAFLDVQNISAAAARMRWKTDWYLIRQWLSERFGVSRAIMFFGYLPEQENMYRYVRECGFETVFKQVQELPDGGYKANVDAEIVLHAMAEYPNYSGAVLVSGDGDFSCLVRYLKERGKLAAVVAPNSRSVSRFLREAAESEVVDMSEDRAKMTYRPGRPGPKPETAPADGGEPAAVPETKSAPAKKTAKKQILARKPAPAPVPHVPRPQPKRPEPAQKQLPRPAQRPQEKPRRPERGAPAPRPSDPGDFSDLAGLNPW